jgi:opacity protein-like surface antigen
MRIKPVVVFCAVLAWLTAAAVPASAEWFGDFFLGAAFTSNKDLTSETLGARDTFEDVHFDKSFSFGGRGGYWFETAPFVAPAVPFVGLALDVSRFHPDISSQVVTRVEAGGGIEPVLLGDIDLSVTAISFDLMLRWPLLKSQQFPKGQLQPYFTVGPAIFIATADDTINFGPPNHQSDTDTSVGVKVGLGLAWQFHKNLALLGEYRFTHFSPEFEFERLGVRRTVDTTINSHDLLVGISYRF